MRRFAFLLALPLALATPSASAREQAPCAQASVTRGPAPLAVSFTAACDAAAFHWDFGDGSAADGTTASHTFAAGRFGVTLTVTQADGSTATERVGVDSIAVALSSRRVGSYGRPALFAGRVVPTERGAVRLYRAGRLVNSARVKGDGSFRMRTRLLAPGPWQARFEQAVSPAVSVLVRPSLVARFEGSGAIGTPLALVARLVPGRAGQIEVRIWRNGTLRVVKTYARGARIPLGTGETATYRVSVASVPAGGFARASRVLSTRLFLPTLRPGSSGANVARLVSLLGSLHYAVRRSSSFGAELVDSIYAFQKVQGLPRTGVADAATWRALGRPRIPHARYPSPADHLEVDKAHQVLYVVRGGGIALIVPVSTAGIPGYFTPEGRFGIYRKVVGFDASPLGTLFDPMYFTGGYAVHGNPSVPPYPASHGCVRVPMWIAPYLFQTNGYGETVYVYS
jgi:L,D-transpeptidase-like protein/PKD domain-containing protein/putative peptidoglycan binding protein